MVSTAARKASGAGPETPPPPVAPPSVVTVSSQQVLAEMRERRIIDKGVETWTADDKDILERARLAENMGAFDFLREARGRRLRGLIVIRKEPGEGRRPLLTKAGFQEYIFIKSQKARTFFEKRTDAKFVFGVTTMDGKKIFDNRGLLSADGDFLFNQILGGSIVKWKEPNGTERSNAARKP
ncbi:MAG: hypothetical protein HY078_14425 [Elusimicrobia bacterium]|nr:hypothetical protein [Elusimicrobiota bacterium]